MADRQIATDWHARDVDDFLAEILPERFATTRYARLRSAILDWAEELAYEHGKERFEAGEEAGRESGAEQAERDIVENIAYELRYHIGGDPWSHRAREAGLDARAVNLSTDILGSVVLPVDDVTLTMPEHEAYRLLGLVRSA